MEAEKGDPEDTGGGDNSALGKKKFDEFETQREKEEFRRQKAYDGQDRFQMAQPELCDYKFEYVEQSVMIPDRGFWEAYVVKVLRQQCTIGTVIACFDQTAGPMDDVLMVAYGLVRETNPFIFQVVPFDLQGSASAWPRVGRLIQTESVYVFNSYGLSIIPQPVRDVFGVNMRAVANPAGIQIPPPFHLPGVVTTLGDTSYKAKLNADKLMGIKNLLRHDKLKSERLFGSLDIIDNQKAKASISSLLLKSQLGMMMLQPQNLPMLVQLIHQRNYVQVSDISKTVAGLHFMHFEVPNTKQLYHRRIVDCANSFVAVLRQIAGGMRTGIGLTCSPPS